MKEEIVVQVQHHQHHRNEEEQRRHKEEEMKRKRGCRPLAFLIGFPFALCGLLLCFAGSIVWILGSLLSYVCPCLKCCSDLANKAMEFIKFPIHVFQWFIDKIPC
ncbi:hypothetical protein RND81_12G234600 [Saponaria officinalis]|uniref:Transmembrane protein n=1 Tax=Saponaria officinalis TaxID=3572 RepID=A0AAW1HEI3_SAPOF